MSAYESFLTDSVDIHIKSVTSNSWNEDVPDWSESETSIKCKVFNVEYEEVKDRIGQYDNIDYEIYFLDSQNIDLDDRIIYNGNTYEVKRIFNDCEDYYKSVYVKKL